MSKYGSNLIPGVVNGVVNGIHKYGVSDEDYLAGTWCSSVNTPARFEILKAFIFNQFQNRQFRERSFYVTNYVTRISD